MMEFLTQTFYGNTILQWIIAAVIAVLYERSESHGSAESREVKSRGEFFFPRVPVSEFHH